MSYASGRVLGMFIGMLVGLLICFVAFRFLNKNGKVKTEYDERQREIRGVGYKIGFWTLASYLGILIVLEAGEVRLPIAPIVIYFIGFFAGAVALCIYSIWKGAYFGINNVKKRWYIFMIVFAIINFSVGIMAFYEGRMIVDGILETPFINVLCGMLFVVVFVASIIKNICDKESE